MSSEICYSARRVIGFSGLHAARPSLMVSGAEHLIAKVKVFVSKSDR
jgi:hypothetical protein